MSKTIATCIAETNQELNKPQENVFFLTLSRKLEDFPNEFLRTARSTSPIQICAILSTIGPDNLSAVLNLELNQELERIVAAASSQPVLDFEGFSNQVINNLNIRVCNFAANKGQQFKTSLTMLVIEGDILRVIHVGVTKAVLFRDQRIMLLTEEQTVARRYVQMGSISAEQEKTHPENMNLTQYLGKMPQDGPVIADRKIHLKLRDNDELFLMGLGLSRQMPPQMRNSIIVKPITTEEKTKEIIGSAVNYGIKSGLTLIDLKIESTFLLPGDAVINSNLASGASVAAADRARRADDDENFTSFDDDRKNGKDTGKADSDTINFVPGGNKSNAEEPAPIVNARKEKIMTVVIPIIIFFASVVVGFAVMFAIFNMKNLLDFTPETSVSDSVATGSVLYAVNDGTPVYSEASTDSTVIASLNRGDAVTLQEASDGTFTKIVTSNNVTGYVLTVAMSDQDPTYNDETSAMLADPTPAPTVATTTAATSAPTTVSYAITNATTTTTTTESTTEAPEPETTTAAPAETTTEATTTTTTTEATTTESTTETTTAAAVNP
ncbi:MAG: SH3 domain-containing protein [Mageeibacillus sp.]|jgi:serine/threonine protein phosphatase PrpC|nr:SH3 domain-containing protein [Mageeibacillus sp.]MCI1264617.1 SH3 domain-containing protein [Saccharofermentans sp.]MCI1770009.1 SH3 domain-containing protein [Mageeibacillus sp.]